MKMPYTFVKQIGRVSEHVVPLSESQEKRAVRLHEESIVFDLHMHSWILPDNKEEIVKWSGERRAQAEVGYDGVKKGGLTAFIDCLGGLAHSWTFDNVVESFGFRLSNMDRNYDKVIRGLRAEDVKRAKDEGKFAIFLGVENADQIHRDLDLIDVLHGLGVRCMGLSYNVRNAFADGRTERTDGGLSELGQEAIARMNTLGIIVDAVHSGEQVTLDAAAASTAPIIVRNAFADGRTERTDGGLSELGQEAIARMNTLGIIVDAVHSGEQVTLDAAAASTAPIIVRNAFADGRTERTDGGLSELGQEAIARMNTLGIIVDAVHSGEQVTLDAAAASTAPIIVSHMGARGVYPTKRMATDEELRAVAGTGGVVGVHSGPNVLSNKTRQSVADLVDHIDYCVKLIGIDHVAAGTDNYFGDKAMNVEIEMGSDKGMKSYIDLRAPYMEGIESPSEWPNITRELVRRDYSDEDIQKIIGGNTLRIVEAVVG